MLFCGVLPPSGKYCYAWKQKQHIYIPKLNFIVSLIEITSPHFILQLHTIHMATDKKRHHDRLFV